MPLHGVCRNFVLLSLQLKTKKRKKIGMSQKPSYLCIVNQTKTVDKRFENIKIKIVLTIKNL